MRLKTWAALAAALSLPLLSACGDDNAQQGKVRLINATTEYTSLDLYTVNSDGSDNLVVGGTAAGAASGYDGVDRGSYTFQVKSSTGAGTAATTTGAVTKTDHFSVVTALTGGSATATFLSDDEDNPASGNAKLRIFNAASGEAPSVDVYLSTNACNALTVTDTPFASAITGLQTTYSQLTSASAGTTWNVCVFANGDTTTLLLDIPALTLKNQEIATLILTHTPGGVLLNGAVLDQQGAMTSYASTLARVRVAADATLDTTGGLVSVSINGTAVSAEAASPSVGSYVTIPSGALTTSITVDGVTTNGTALPSAAAGSDYTLLVTGSSSNPAATLITDDNTPSTSTTLPVKARVINGVNGRTGTLSATVDAKTLGNAAFGAASPYATLVATSGISTVVPTSVTTTPANLVNQSFTSGQVYTVFIWGNASAPVLTLSSDR